MLTGKKVLVLGLARSGKAAVELLLHLNATVTVNESKKKEDILDYQDLVDRGVEMVVGGQPEELFERDFDMVIKNPGIKYTLPFILRLKERKIPVYTEIELAYQVCKPQHYIAITGTNGKTTTTTLVYEMLAKYRNHVHVAGNIGTPLCEVVLKEDLLHQEGHIIVLEMSNFQLLDVDSFKPKVSTIINLTPDHLDYMRNLDEYYASKCNIYKKQNQHDLYLLNLDDEVIQDYTSRYPIPASIMTYSLYQESDACVKDSALYFAGRKIMDCDEVKMVGNHNLQNVLISILIAKSCGLEDEQIHDFIASFKGVEHRIEYVDTKRGITYYNDSKATNTDATIIALKAFKQPVILLLGGFDKGLDMEDVAKYNHCIKHLVTFGVAGPRFKEDMHHPSSYYEENLEKAVLKATKLAESGDIILLSPSTSSFDEFSGFEERGRVFKKIVGTL